MGELQLVFYLAIIVFFAVIVSKTAKIARMPLHLRWDLYPIPHEKGRGKYGGSYFEEIDWWTKPRQFSFASELLEMMKEIVLIQSLWRNNRPLWIFSFPFHLGMYCLIGFILMLLLGVILELGGVPISISSPHDSGVIIHRLTVILGTTGWVLGIFGALGLILSRIVGKELRKASMRSDYSNLVVLLAVFIAGFVSWLTVDSSYTILRGFFQNLITLKASGALPVAITVQLWLTAILLLYLPFTQMTHFVGKYFTYHRIRWEDEPNIRGSKIERAVTEALGYKLDWSAPHIKTGGTWADAATGETSKDE